MTQFGDGLVGGGLAGGGPVGGGLVVARLLDGFVAYGEAGHA